MSPEERLRSQRAARLKADQALLRELQDAYGRSFDQVRRELARLTKQIAEARAAGGNVSPAWLFEAQRLQRFERELGQNLAIYLDLAKRKIEAASVRALIDGQTDARSLLVSTVPGGLGVAPALPVEQLERMVLGTRPGTPLGTLLAGLGARAQQEAREKLIEGLPLDSERVKLAATFVTPLPGTEYVLFWWREPRSSALTGTLLYRPTARTRKSSRAGTGSLPLGHAPVRSASPGTGRFTRWTRSLRAIPRAVALRRRQRRVGRILAFLANLRRG